MAADYDRKGVTVMIEKTLQLLVGNEIFDIVASVLVGLNCGFLSIPFAEHNWNEDESRQECGERQSFHSKHPSSLSGDDALCLPQFKKDDGVPGLPFHFLDEQTFQLEPFLTGEQSKTVSHSHSAVPCVKFYSNKETNRRRKCAFCH